MDDPVETPPEPSPAGAEPLKLWVDADLSRAFRRCLWIIVHETGRTQVDIMNEMVRDFLVKHQC